MRRYIVNFIMVLTFSRIFIVIGFLVFEIRAVTGERRISATSQQIVLNFGKNDYVSHTTLCAKNGGRRKGVWPGGIGEFVRLYALFIYLYFFSCSFFSTFNPPTAYSERRDLIQNTANMCFGGNFFTAQRICPSQDVCPSVCSSVCLSITSRYSVDIAQHICNFFYLL